MFVLTLLMLLFESIVFVVFRLQFTLELRTGGANFNVDKGPDQLLGMVGQPSRELVWASLDCHPRSCISGAYYNKARKGTYLLGFDWSACSILALRSTAGRR